LIADPSKNYLIDGFPRALDCALDFEADCVEVQQILCYNVSEEECLQRMLGRAEGRSDDNVETLKNRINVFKDQTMPVLDMYRKFGKVTEISGEAEIDVVYA